MTFHTATVPTATPDTTHFSNTPNTVMATATATSMTVGVATG